MASDEDADRGEDAAGSGEPGAGDAAEEGHDETRVMAFPGLGEDRQDRTRIMAMPPGWGEEGGWGAEGQASAGTEDGTPTLESMPAPAPPLDDDTGEQGAPPRAGDSVSEKDEAREDKDDDDDGDDEDQADQATRVQMSPLLGRADVPSWAPDGFSPAEELDSATRVQTSPPFPPVPGDGDPDAAAVDQEATPPHLQLPNIDFALPLGAADADDATQVGLPPPLEGTPALPAHLQLPNFPDLGVLGGSAASAAESSDEEAGQQTSGLSGKQSGGPPALPPSPPPARKTAAPPAPAELPGLPALDLPDIEPVAPKRDLTLISSEASLGLKAALDAGRSFPTTLVVAVVIVALLGGAAFFSRGHILAFFRPPAREVSQAEKDKLAAQRAHVQGVEAFQKNRHRQAKEAFLRAMALDKTFAEPHRGLAIVYAKLKEQEKAVEEYKLYLQLAPHADDRSEVEKIIADYEMAKAKKDNEGSKPTKDAADTPRRRRRRR